MADGDHRDGDFRVQGVARPAPVTFTFDGHTVRGIPGETVAAALWADATRGVRRSSAVGEPRALFCNMGICYECLVQVDGRIVRACVTPVRAGLTVTTGGRPPGHRYPGEERLVAEGGDDGPA